MFWLRQISVYVNCIDHARDPGNSCGPSYRAAKDGTSILPDANNRGMKLEPD